MSFGLSVSCRSLKRKMSPHQSSNRSPPVVLWPTPIRRSSVTAKQVASIVMDMDMIGENGTTLEVIRNRIKRIKQPATVTTEQIRKALKRACDSGMIKELTEDRFKLSRRMQSNLRLANSVASRTRSRTVTAISQSDTNNAGCSSMRESDSGVDEDESVHHEQDHQQKQQQPHNARPNASLRSRPGLKKNMLNESSASDMDSQEGESSGNAHNGDGDDRVNMDNASEDREMLEQELTNKESLVEPLMAGCGGMKVFGPY